MTSSEQDSGVCSKSDSGDVINMEIYDDVTKQDDDDSEKSCSDVSSVNLMTSRRSSFREKIERMMKRNSTSSHLPLDRRNSSERNVTSSSDVSEKIRQRLRVTSDSSDEGSVVTSQPNLQEKLGELLIGDGEEKCSLYDHQSGTKPSNRKLPSNELTVTKQQNKIPEDWRWRVLEHLRRKKVIPPLRNNDVIMRSKTPAVVTSFYDNHQRQARPKSAMNFPMTSQSAYMTRSANDVTNYQQRQTVEVCLNNSNLG